ncbi:Protein png1 [Extremus antarcticus]|uniref:Protein png1 n=1 Tax=Extremus antarcticus TaxID=702011 RepID=A0AAJ0GI50_9PEZI|nr:Protein png1 [Extremus antarcticus]
MADNNDRGRIPRRKPVPKREPALQTQQQPLPETWAADLTQQFRRTLSTKRMNALSSRPGSQRRRVIVDQQQPPSQTPPHATDASSPTPPPLPSRNAPQPPQQPPDEPPLPPPPSYSSLKYLPIVPTPPTDQKSLRFRNMLLSLSATPLHWENPGLLDEALGAVPLERIYNEAQEESDLFEAEAQSLGPNTKAAWGYQDCVIRALLKWFKRDFFEWVNNPRCSTCLSPTIAHGMAHPLPDESARGANRVELYKCANAQCMSFERFARYNDAFVLLQTRKGRCGEWANCFSMLCRAMGGRVRWLWNAEDHVWTEVYSVHRKRWVHVDCCEEAWDAPLLYAKGWGKKMSYVLAFGADGCADVTRRYVRDQVEHTLPRNRCPEGVIVHIVQEINSLRRRDMDKKQRFQLNAEDMKEDAEFRKNIIEALAYNIGRLSPGGEDEKGGRRNDRGDPDAQKAAEGRSSGSREWVRRRGEGGPNNDGPPGPDQNRDQRQQ